MIKIYNGSEVIPLKVFRFSGGEMQVKILEDTASSLNNCRIEANIHNSDDIMVLFLLTDALRRQYSRNMAIKLVMPYIPYARQDRVCDKGEAMALKVFCTMVNSMNYHSVEVHDPHSDVAVALLDRCEVVEQWEFLQTLHHHLTLSNTVLVSPDAGANKKTQKVARLCGFQTIYQADKVRDVKTGAITDTIVYGEHVGDKDFLIVDDICDGGRTFIELTKKLKELTTGKIYLYVTHSILSKGLMPLMIDIEHLFTANTWAEHVNSDYITILKY